MKKIITACLCVLLVAALAITAFAAGTSFSGIPSKTTLSRGDEVTISFNVSASEKATSYGLMLEYDTTVFELVDGTCAVPGALVNSFMNGFAFMFQNPTAYSGAIGTVTLKVKDDAPIAAVTVKGNASVTNGSTPVTAQGCTIDLEVVCNHSFGAWTKVDADTHERTCTKCGKPETANHKWDNGVETTPATCQGPGEKTYTCADCGATKTSPIDQKDHEYGPWTKVDDAKHSRTCKYCPDTQTEDHAFASELTAGADTHWNECACGAKANETAHAFDAAWTTDDDYHWHACACGAKSGEAKHTWDEGVVTKEPEGKNKGEKTYTCTECQKTKVVKFGNPATGDNAMLVPAILLVTLSGLGITAMLWYRKKNA